MKTTPPSSLPGARRQVLRTLATLAVSGHFPPFRVARGRPARPLAESAARGRRFLASLFDPDVGLLPEFRGAGVCWLYHDNYLAAKVLDRSEPGLARRIEGTIRRNGVEGSPRVELLFGEAKQPLPFRTHRLIDVSKAGGRVIKTEVAGETPLKDWKEYIDLLLLGAIAQAGGDRREALEDFERALTAWDGRGFKDRVNEKGAPYATFKLALALIAAARLGQKPRIQEGILGRLLAMQGEDGGFLTDYDASGGPIGKANVETTSLAILALDGVEFE